MPTAIKADLTTGRSAESPNSPMSKPTYIRGEILPPLSTPIDVAEKASADKNGAIPIIGDFAHVAWKANRRNYNLLLRDHQSVKRHTWQDWMFVIGTCMLLCLLYLGPFVLLIYLFKTHHPFH
jgi:hypothetical protein